MTDSTSSVLSNDLGIAAEAYPLLAERIAIEVTNALRGAEAGLRGFRNRPLLRRLWDGLTGRGQEFQAAIGQDLATVQHATLSLVQEVMKEKSRTQYCVNKVLTNLHAVNHDVDELLHRTASQEQAIQNLRAKIIEETKHLAAEIDAVQRQIDREANVRRLTEHYRAGDLTAGPGKVLGSALYMASVVWNYWEEPKERREAEWKAARAVVRQGLDAAPRPTTETLLEMAEAISPDSIESVLYLTESATGVLRVTGMLAARRAADLRVQEKDVEDAVSIVRTLADPDKQLESFLVRDSELVDTLAQELIPHPGVRGE